MAQPMLPEAKVTIFVETFNGVDVIQVPLAAKPEIATSKTYDLEGKPAQEHHVGFSCYALYDIDQNIMAHQELRRGVTMDTVILTMARDILRKRAEQ
ncbi:hypothetical protein SEA_MEDIUMFRY_78 [Arthrobacter phage MediumFry]|nr:hypothetical protein SEA_MEDIUMFRY_78 [Arthrobacter phage MediumFry]